MSEATYTNIGQGERIARVVLGLGLVLDVMHGSGPLGWASLIPLFSIYPSMTGFLGYDPVYSLFGFSTAGRRHAVRAGKSRVRHAKSHAVVG